MHVDAPEMYPRHHIVMCSACINLGIQSFRFIMLDFGPWQPGNRPLGAGACGALDWDGYECLPLTFPSFHSQHRGTVSLSKGSEIKPRVIDWRGD